MTKQETFKRRVIGQGRVQIPCEVRELLDVKEGDFVKVTVAKVEA